MWSYSSPLNSQSVDVTRGIDTEWKSQQLEDIIVIYEIDNTTVNQVMVATEKKNPT